MAGGGTGMTLSELAAAGAATGLDEAAIAFFAVLTNITVSLYIDACALCIVKTWSSTGMSWLDLLASTNDSTVQNQLAVAANDQGIDTSGTAVG
jgi:hypothetical protein